MNDDVQTTFPTSNGGSQDAVAPSAPASGPVFLEGMKVLFDEKVGLYPVDLVAKSKKGKRNGS